MTKTVSLRLPDSLLVEVDALGGNRDEFFRRAIEEKIARARGNEAGLLDMKRRNRTWRELDVDWNRHFARRHRAGRRFGYEGADIIRQASR